MYIFFSGKMTFMVVVKTTQIEIKEYCTHGFHDIRCQIKHTTGVTSWPQIVGCHGLETNRSLCTKAYFKHL